MSKIGLLTFHQCHNCGAMLQAYALQEKLRALGYSVEIIDVENERFTEHGKKAGHNLYRAVGAETLQTQYGAELRERWERFERFQRDFMNCSPPVSSGEELREIVGNYDILMVGGDQLWNLSLPVFHPYFFLPFHGNANKLAFGTSLGSTRELPLELRFWLRSFRAIGIREATGVPYLTKYACDSIVKKVGDPVFLQDARFWRRLARSHHGRSGYILGYLFNRGDGAFVTRIKYLAKLAQAWNKELVVIANDVFEPMEGVQLITAVGPREWLSWIDCASVVITNSFHGLAFSMLFEKDFWVLDADSRQLELLADYKLMHRCVNNLKKIDLSTEINQSELLPQIMLDRERSVSFLAAELERCIMN